MANNTKKSQSGASTKADLAHNQPKEEKRASSPAKKSRGTSKRFTPKNVVLNIFYGLVIGSSMLVPGVSGGTMAIILGIYDELIEAVGNIFKKFKNSFLLILQVAVGAIAGIFLFSGMILKLVNTYKLPMMYLFMGAMLGSIPSLFRKGRIRGINPLNFIWIIVGGGLVYALNFLPKGQFTEFPNDLKGYALLFLCGIIIAVALVLPGISTSHILLVLGIYETVWSAVTDLTLEYILPIFFGVIAGILLTTKLLDKAMTKLPHQTYLMIIGFVLASIIDVCPGFPSGAGYDMVLCIGAAIFGAGVVYLISR